MPKNYKNLKNELDKTFLEMQKKKFNQEDNSNLAAAIGKDIIDAVSPALIEHSKQFQSSTQEIIREVLKEIKVEMPQIDSPQFDNEGLKEVIASAIAEAFSNVRIPEPRSTVNVPPIRVPDIKMPEEMSVKGFVSLMGIDLGNPLPVQLRNADGSPFKLAESVGKILGGGSGGGKADFLTIKGAMASVFSELLNPDGRVKVETLDSGSGATTIVDQLSGSAWSTYVRPQAVGDEKTSDVLRVYQVADSIVSTKIVDQSAALIIDQLSGAQFSSVVRPQASGDEKTSDVLRVYQVSDSSVSTQAKLIARQTNPTAASDGASAFQSSDDLGRTLTRPIQVRDLTKTAYATLTTGTETTLRAAVAGAYLDLIHIIGANNSDVAVTVDIRAVTAGNVIMSLQIPANGTAGIACPVPIPQDETGNNWTADMGDLTGTTVYLTALFSQEV